MPSKRQAKAQQELEALQAAQAQIVDEEVEEESEEDTEVVQSQPKSAFAAVSRWIRCIKPA